MNRAIWIAVIGDSITEQKQYSVFMEDYLLDVPAGREAAGGPVWLGWRGRPTVLRSG